MFERERMCSNNSNGKTPNSEAPTSDSVEKFEELNMESVLSARFPVTLKFTDIHYRVKLQPAAKTGFKHIFRSKTSTKPTEEKTILNGISGMVSPGEILAILGPSGSGKSTLLNTLGGRLEGRYSGTVTANGHKLTKPILRTTGFVTQDDVLYPHLTVRETLIFCCLLRLPKTLTKSEKVTIAETVINELGLNKCANTIIGSAFVRGVSGGERKRVSIGHEMLVNPSLLLLDEPTSGLDSTAANRLVSMLGGLAGKGKTVVTTMHQPSSWVYQMFTNVLLLSEGNCLYFGRGNEAMDYLCSVIGFRPSFAMNPADFMLDLANGEAQDEMQGGNEKGNTMQALMYAYNKTLEPKVKACIQAHTIPRGDTQLKSIQRCNGKDRNSHISWFQQFTVLLHRSLKERRFESLGGLRVFQVVAAAVLAGTMWWHSNPHNVEDRLGLLFFIAIFWGVFPVFNSVFTFPQERAIFLKERSSGMYTLSSYFMARTAGDLPMELLLPTAFTVIAYWMAGLKPDPASFLLTLLILLSYVLVAQGLGLAFGAIIMDAKQATTAASVTMLAFLLTGGFYVQKVPIFMGWIKYVSFTFYCYRLLIGVQYGEGEVEALLVDCRSGRSDVCEAVVKQVEGQVCAVVSIGVLVFMLVGYRLIAYLALRQIKV